MVAGVSITITIFYEYIFMNILASFRRRHPPPAAAHTHIHIWWSVVFSQLIGGQINQRPYLQSICWEGAAGSRRLALAGWTITGSGGTARRRWRHRTSPLAMFRTYRCHSPGGGLFFFGGGVYVLASVCEFSQYATKKLLSTLCCKENSDFGREGRRFLGSLSGEIVHHVFGRRHQVCSSTSFARGL